MRRKAAKKSSTKLNSDQKLLISLKARLPELQTLLARVNDHWIYEDMVYRFYHHSFKVYGLQSITQEIVHTLRSLSPEANFNQEFQEIFEAGASGKHFTIEHNKNWADHTRVFLEAFFHAKFFLEMAVNYGRNLDEAPQVLPSGWAALLYFYGMR